MMLREACALLDMTWRKSSRSGDNGACVEVRRTPAAVQMRDSKDRLGPTLTFTADSWQSFVAAIHSGDFDGGGEFDRGGVERGDVGRGGADRR